MEDITALLENTTHLERTNAANNIITRYDLHFSTDDILKAFKYLRNQLSESLQSMIDLMYLSLTTNLRMFMAIIYSLLAEDNKMTLLDYGRLYLRRYPNPTTLGCCYTVDENVVNAIKSWSTLYDYYEFDTSELTLSKPLRIGIQEHINSRARYTKPAIK